MGRVKVLAGYERLLERWRFRFLLGLLLVVIFAQPMVHAGGIERTVLILLLGAVFAGALHATRESSGLPVSAVGMAALWFALTALAAATEGRLIDLACVLATVCLALLVTWGTFAALVREAKADLDALGGAIFGFFLLAVVWAEIFRAVEIWQPGSFMLLGEPAPQGEFLYLSLVTITTLGYGDFLPVAPLARILTGIEAAFGTLYIAILIGRIVGAFRASPHG